MGIVLDRESEQEPLESNPRAEVVTLIAEPDSAAGQRAWRTVFARRVAGPEDRVEGSDLLAAIRLSGITRSPSSRSTRSSINWRITVSGSSPCC